MRDDNLGSKQDMVNALAALIGVPAPPMSTGSTEPREIFALVNRELGLGIDPRSGKPDLARAIVEAAGYTWDPDCESRGATVTRTGIARVLLAVRALLA